MREEERRISHTITKPIVYYRSNSFKSTEKSKKILGSGNKEERVLADNTVKKVILRSCEAFQNTQPSSFFFLNKHFRERERETKTKLTKKNLARF